MEKGTYVLINGIDPKLSGLSMDEVILKTAKRKSEEFELLDSQFADDKENRKKYETDKGYLYLYSPDVSGNFDIFSPTITIFRIFKLSSIGTGISVVVNGDEISCNHNIMETANSETEKFPIFTVNDIEYEKLDEFCHRHHYALSNPEWRDGIINLENFYNEAYKIANSQTAYMNLIIAAEIYRKWAEDYMIKFANIKEVVETENTMKGKGGRISGTKKIAVLISRLIRHSNQDINRGLIKMISQLYYQRNDFIHEGKPIDDVCYHMLFDTIRCLIGKMIICGCSKDELFRTVMKNKVPTEIPDTHFTISDTDIDDLIMGFDR